MRNQVFATIMLAGLASLQKAAAYVGDAEFEARRELSIGENSKSLKDQWMVTVEGLEEDSPECDELERKVRMACNPFLRAAGSSEESTASAFEDACIISFSCPEKIINSDGLAHLGIRSDDLQPNMEVFAEGLRGLEGTAEIQTGSNLPWGLDRIEQPKLPLDKTFSSPYSGKGVNVYVIDTGVNSKHEEFKGRFFQGGDFVKENRDGDDMNGHGSHCAGTAVGSQYGVAKKANVFGVKVLGRRGSGDIGGVVKGIKWAVSNQKKKFGRKAAVLSISLGGGHNKAMDKAVRAASRAGMIVVVAAGNQNSDACNYSPARAGGNGRNGGVVTVMSSDSKDKRSSFSNYGKCTDIIAPGSNVKSAWFGGSKSSKTISGTSMATPHVTGVAATLLEKHNFNKAKAVAELFANGVFGQIRDTKRGSENLLLQVASNYQGAPTVAPTPPPTFDEPSLKVGSFKPSIKFSSFGPSLPESKRTSHKIVLAKNQGNEEGCNRFKNSLKGSAVLIKRGGCDFITKVRNAQKKGADIVIISQDSNAVPFPPGSRNGEVDIVSGMVSRNHGNKIEQLARAGIMLEMGPEQ